MVSQPQKRKMHAQVPMQSGSLIFSRTSPPSWSSFRSVEQSLMGTLPCPFFADEIRGTIHIDVDDDATEGTEGIGLTGGAVTFAGTATASGRSFEVCLVEDTRCSSIFHLPSSTVCPSCSISPFKFDVKQARMLSPVSYLVVFH